MTKEFRNQLIGYIVSAFGLVAALAWNDAIKSLINHFYRSPTDTLGAQFTYAVAVTVVVVIVTINLMRFKERQEK